MAEACSCTAEQRLTFNFYSTKYQIKLLHFHYFTDDLFTFLECSFCASAEANLKQGTCRDGADLERPKSAHPLGKNFRGSEQTKP